MAADGRLRILFLQEAPCIRNYKLASALRGAGHHVTSAWIAAPLRKMYTGLADEDAYDASVKLDSIRDIWKLAGDFDVVHSHNEPDQWTLAALGGHTPVVHDTHDLVSLRAGGDETLGYFEALANRLAQGRVYTTQGMYDEAAALYDIPEPSLVHGNYALRADMPAEKPAKLSASDGQVHVVYQGGFGMSGHRGLSGMVSAIARQGVRVHVFPTRFDPQVSQALAGAMNVVYHRPVSPKALLGELARYDVGIIPFDIEQGDKRFLDTSVANKYYEYLGAGLPVLTSDLRSYRELFEAGAPGAVFADPDDAAAKALELAEVGRRADASEHTVWAEDRIGRLVDFYRDVIERRRGS